ncbi:MAG: PfkB family carbohydrate kinase [Bradymonadaceae bacterium]
MLIVGHTTHDRYGDDIRAGGCAYYGAKVYDALGADLHLATLVGEDFQCDRELEGLDKTVRRHGETTFFANLYPQRGPRLQLVAAWAPMMRPEMFDEALLDDEVVHLAPVLGQLDLVEWKEAVDPEFLAINVQGWIKIPDPDAGARADISMPDGADVIVQRPWEVTVEELEGVDVASLSDEDLIDQGDLEERLVEAIPVVAVTHGADGASIYVDGKETRLGVYESAEVVDPTGAGDTFAAAFVHRLHESDDPVEAGRFASAAASIVIEGEGASAVDRLDEAAERAEAIEPFRK